jgi:hypothetical protein
VTPSHLIDSPTSAGALAELGERTDILFKQIFRIPRSPFLSLSNIKNKTVNNSQLSTATSVSNLGHQATRFALPVPSTRRSRSSSTCQQKDHRLPSGLTVSSTPTHGLIQGLRAPGRSFRFSQIHTRVINQNKTSSNNVRHCRIRPCGQPPSREHRCHPVRRGARQCC